MVTFDSFMWFTLREQQRRSADVMLSNPEEYFDTPGYGDNLSQPVMEVRDTMEGEDRYPDLDGAAPLGRPSSTAPGLASEMLEGDEGTLEGQTGTGYHQREADRLPGGRGDDRPDEDFCPDALEEGMQHELEHTDDEDLAREIAKDHLSEDPKYYTKLRRLEGAKMGPLGEQLLLLRPQLATAAQRVLDDWDQDESGEDFELGSGGACDAIAREMSDVLSGLDAEIVEGGQPGDDHSYLIVFDADEAYEVDIPSALYEVGGGYSWRKLPDVQVRAEDVVVAPIPREWIESDELNVHGDYGASISVLVNPGAGPTPVETSPQESSKFFGRDARVHDQRTLKS